MTFDDRKPAAPAPVHPLVRPRRIALHLGLGFGLVLSSAWLPALLIPFPSTHTVLLQRELSRQDWWLVARADAPLGVRYQSVVMPRALEYQESDAKVEVP